MKTPLGNILGTRERRFAVSRGQCRSVPDNAKHPRDQGVYVILEERRRWESNPCTGLCRPLPKPLGHVAMPARASRETLAPTSRIRQGYLRPRLAGARRVRALNDAGRVGNRVG